MPQFTIFFGSHFSPEDLFSIRDFILNILKFSLRIAFTVASRITTVSPFNLLDTRYQTTEIELLAVPNHPINFVVHGKANALIVRRLPIPFDTVNTLAALQCCI